MTTTGPNLEQPSGPASGHALCWLCSQPSPRLETHVLDTDHYPVLDCAHAPGTGVELCPMCHTSVHNWMRSHGSPGTAAAKAGLEAVFERFTTAVLGFTSAIAV